MVAKIEDKESSASELEAPYMPESMFEVVTEIKEPLLPVYPQIIKKPEVKKRRYPRSARARPLPRISESLPHPIQGIMQLLGIEEDQITSISTIDDAIEFVTDHLMDLHEKLDYLQVKKTLYGYESKGKTLKFNDIKFQRKVEGIIYQVETLAMK